MATLTANAKSHSPTGDPDHIAYGKDFIWSCTCGKTGGSITSKKKATYRADKHERYCDGETTVDTA